MLKIRRSPREEGRTSINIYENDRFIGAIKIVDIEGDSATIGCTADQSVTFLRGEVPFDPDLKRA